MSTVTDNSGDYALQLESGSYWHVLFGDDIEGPTYTPAYTSCPTFCGFEEYWYVDAPAYSTSASFNPTPGETIPGIGGKLTAIPVKNS